MTLCLAWKVNNEINLLSDSRLTKEEKILTNNANKIYSIYVNAYKGTLESRKEIYSAKYGLCFAGSYLNGSLLADTISELTTEIFVEDVTDLNFDLINEIAFFVYENVSRHLMEINRFDTFSEVFFTGTNPIDGQTELSKFSFIIDDNKVTFLNEKIQLKNNHIFYLGNSKAIELAQSLEHKINQTFTHFHLLSKIITDNNILEVGGCIQYGCLLNGNFRTYGIVDFDYYKLEDINVFLTKNTYSFRGLPMNLEDTKIKNLNCRINKVYMSPFTDKEKQIEEKVKQLNNIVV